MRRPAAGGGNHQQQQQNIQQHFSSSTLSNLSTSPSDAWFMGAPTTKLITIVTIGCYVLAHGYKNDYYVDLLYFDSRKMWNEPFRYFTSKLTFATSVSELACGTLLMGYLMRKYEREMGSRKFIAYLLIVNVLSCIMEFLILMLGIFWTSTWIYSGPYPIIGGMFLGLFHQYTPRLYPRFISVLGFQCSEKSLYYLGFLQVCFVGKYNTIIPTLLGTGATLLYLSTPLSSASSRMTPTTMMADSRRGNSGPTPSLLGGIGTDGLDIPDSLFRFFAPFGERFLEAPPPLLIPHAARTRSGGARRDRGTGGGGNGGMDAQEQILQNILQQTANQAQRQAQQQQQQQPPPEPDPEAIEQLIMMGFDREQVVAALRTTRNDVQRAADRLLQQAGVM